MEFQDLSTDTLVQLVRDGQVGSFDAIVKRYQLDVARKVNMLLLNRSGVEDLVQDVFYRAYVRLDQYKVGTSFRNWLMGIAHNAVLHELRRSRRYDGRLQRYADLIEVRLNEDSTELEDEDRVKALMDCIGRLEPQTANMVRARYTQQLSIDQIAQTSGRTSGAVRTFLYRARAQLRECLEHKGAWR